MLWDRVGGRGGSGSGGCKCANRIDAGVETFASGCESLNDIGNDSGVGFEAAERCLHRSEVGCEGSGADVGVDKELVESVVGRGSEGGEALFGVSCEGSEVALECELLAEEAVHISGEWRITLKEIY